MTDYVPGQKFKTTVTFRDYDDTVQDPTTITFKYLSPAGTITTIVYPAAGITRTSQGIYWATFTAATEGAWWSRWEGTGTVVAADEDGVQVRASMFV